MSHQRNKLREQLYDRLVRHKQVDIFQNLLNMSSNNSALHHLQSITKSRTCERCRQLLIDHSYPSSPSTSPTNRSMWGSPGSNVGSPGSQWGSPGQFENLHSTLWHKPYLQTADILQHTLTNDCNYSGPLGELRFSPQNSDTRMASSPIPVSVMRFPRDLPLSPQLATSPLVLRFDPEYQRDTTVVSRSWYE